MQKCIYCGNDFDPKAVKRRIDKKFGRGNYEDSFPESNVCFDCAYNELYEAQEEYISNLSMEDMKDIINYPCRRCGTSVPNDDGIFICPKCGEVFSDSDVYDRIKGYW